MSPTARTLAELRRLGCLAESVERWIPQAKVRRDLFGIGDVIWCDGKEIGLLQATTGANLAAREAKARASPHLRRWLQSGGLFWLWGWSLKGERGKRKTWQVTKREIRFSDLPYEPEGEEKYP